MSFSRMDALSLKRSLASSRTHPSKCPTHGTANTRDVWALGAHCFDLAHHREALWQRLLGRPASECGRLRHGGGDPEGATAAGGG
jgi:hypothetical protein